MTEDELDAYAERVAAEAPPLTRAQQDRLAVLLRQGQAEERAA